MLCSIFALFDDEKSDFRVSLFPPPPPPSPPYSPPNGVETVNDTTRGRRSRWGPLPLEASAKPDVRDTTSIISEMEDWARSVTPETFVKRSSKVQGVPSVFNGEARAQGWAGGGGSFVSRRRVYRRIALLCCGIVFLKQCFRGKKNSRIDRFFQPKLFYRTIVTNWWYAKMLCKFRHESTSEERVYLGVTFGERCFIRKYVCVCVGVSTAHVSRKCIQ